MGLDFGGGLFPQQGLLQKDGLLSERWGQQGSTVYNIYEHFNADATIHTVTAGKTFYISEIWISNYDAAGGTILMRDGGAAGTIKIIIVTLPTTGDEKHIIFKTPLEMTTDIYLDENGACDKSITVSGWEE